MNGHTEMPTIGFSKDADYDTMHSVLTGWCCRVWLKGGFIVVAKWEGEKTLSTGDDGTFLRVWSNDVSDFVTEVVVPTDDITRIEVL